MASDLKIHSKICRTYIEGELSMDEVCGCSPMRTRCKREIRNSAGRNASRGVYMRKGVLRSNTVYPKVLSNYIGATVFSGERGQALF
jgi:hypothetical protein